MATHCPRCGTQVHGLPADQPHLCSDISKRLARREKQVEAVRFILMAHGFNADLHAGAGSTRLAERIVTKLAQMGVADD